MTDAFLAAWAIWENTLFVIIGGSALALLLMVALVLSWYKKVPQGKAIVRTGVGGIKISFNGSIVVPVFHKMELMDISIKKVEISRIKQDGLICKDNMRADIKVAFFVRVNPVIDDVKKVAQSVGVSRASREETLKQLFEAKFSEALKSVGKRFEFVELYDNRESFRREIINTIGTNLNGFILDDAAIDYLEQTPIEFLQESNILDSEGIKKITDLTAQQHIAANKIRNEEKKVITQQDVEAQEAILELNRQLAEKEEVQAREVASIKARETAETKKVQEEERLRSEQARIATEEEIAIAEQNKDRQIIVATKAKERTEAVENERVIKDRELEINERERVVTLAQIEKEKSVEEERKNIQEVIRERVIVEKATVTEEEKIKDTREFATANRSKQVALTKAEEEAQQEKIKKLVAAEAEKEAAKIEADTKIIDADAALKSSELEAEATKKMAEAKAAEEAAMGVSEAQVMQAKAEAREIEGAAEAKVIQLQAEASAKEIELKASAEAKKIELRASAEAKEISLKAEAEAKQIELKAAANEVDGLKQAHVKEQQYLADAKGKTANAEAIEREGMAEALTIESKLIAEAKGIEKKAEAMKKLDGVGKEHEEFKLQLEKDKEVELAQINIEAEIAEAQSKVLAEALKSAKIDIVGGEPVFFDKLTQAITRGKTVDGLVNNSQVLSDVRQNLLGNGNLIDRVREVIGQVGLKSEDLRNLSVAAALMRVSESTTDAGIQGLVQRFLTTAAELGISDQPAKNFGL